jgi:hypothetical protein
MKLQKASDFVNENILDDMEQKRRELEEQDRRNAELDAELRRKQAEYQSSKPSEPIGSDRVIDTNIERRQLLTKVNDILQYSMQENDNDPKLEIEAFIEKYSSYIIGRKYNPFGSNESVKTFSNFK